MRKNWIGKCDFCGEKSLVNYEFSEWDPNPEPNMLIVCQDKDSCVEPPNPMYGQKLTKEQQEALDALPF